MKILAMVAHPDDEILGAGGTLARHVNNANDVYIAYLTDGVMARPLAKEENSAAILRRKQAALNAARIIGATVVVTEDQGKLFADNQMDAVPLLQVAKVVESYVAEYKPDVIYTHHGGDLNVDHRICHQAVLTACRPMPGSTVKAIYAMEIPSSTEWQVPNSFQPNLFVDISATTDQKLDALLAYKEEMREYPHPRSVEAIEALFRWRGAISGLEAAEAFMVLWKIV